MHHDRGCVEGSWEPKYEEESGRTPFSSYSTAIAATTDYIAAIAAITACLGRRDRVGETEGRTCMRLEEGPLGEKDRSRKEQERVLNVTTVCECDLLSKIENVTYKILVLSKETNFSRLCQVFKLPWFSTRLCCIHRLEVRGDPVFHALEEYPASSALAFLILHRERCKWRLPVSPLGPAEP